MGSLRKVIGVFYSTILYLIFILTPCYAYSICDCLEEGRNYKIVVDSDSTGLVGSFKVIDCLNDIFIDSGRFDNTHNERRFEIAKYLAEPEQCLRLSEVKKLIKYTWTIGFRRSVTFGGYLVDQVDTIAYLVADSGEWAHITLYRHVVSYNDLMSNTINIYTKENLPGTEQFFFSDGRPKDFKFQIFKGVGNELKNDGPQISFHPSGRIKSIIYFHNGLILLEKRYNKWGIRTYNYRLKL